MTSIWQNEEEYSGQIGKSSPFLKNHKLDPQISQK